jgi:hypothetical protein
LRGNFRLEICGLKFAACLPRWQGCRNANRPSAREIECVSGTDLARYNSSYAS